MELWHPMAVDFFRNRKIRRAGRDAALLYAAGVFYCEEQLTDGVIPTEQVPVLAAEAWTRANVAAVLVREGLWIEVDGGYQVHGWHERSKPAELVLQERERAGARGGKANHVRWHEGRGIIVTECPWCQNGTETDRSRIKNGSESDNARIDPTRSLADPPASPPSPSPSPTDNSSSTGTRGEHPQPVDDVLEAAARIAAEHEADRHDDIRNRDRWCNSRAASIRRDHETTWRTILAADPTTTATQLASQAQRTPEDATVAAQMRRIERNAERNAEAAQTPPAPKDAALAAIEEARTARLQARHGPDPPPAA